MRFAANAALQGDVWVGTLGSERQAATTIVTACVRLALRAGKAVRFEVNEANAAVLAILDQLGLLGEAELGIFAEDGPGLAGVATGW